jgi:Tol biopolymer transport system component
VQTLDQNNRSAIWVYELSGDRAIQQLTQSGNNSRPIWTPDGKRLTFTSDREGTPSIYWQPADGSGVAERLTKAEPKIEHWPDSWSPDGKTLSFTRFGGLGNQSIWLLQVDARGEAKDFGAKESGGSAFSPDGKWLAYRQNDSGFGIFVQPFPATGAVYKVTSNGSYPIWSHDQREMFYRRPFTANNPTTESTASDQLVSIEISTRGIIAFSNERPIPIQSFLTFFGNRDYDVTKDGKQFLMVFPADRSQTPMARPQIDIVLDWFSDLNQRVP